MVTRILISISVSILILSAIFFYISNTKKEKRVFFFIGIIPIYLLFCYLAIVNHIVKSILTLLIPSLIVVGLIFIISYSIINRDTDGAIGITIFSNIIVLIAILPLLICSHISSDDFNGITYYSQINDSYVVLQDEKEERIQANYEAEKNGYNEEKQSDKGSNFVPITNDNISQTVYYTSSGERYHKKSCGTLSRSKILSCTLYEAELKGLTPCQKCMN